MSAKKTTPTRFDLAPLIELAPEIVVPREGDDRFSMLMLALALVFNDLKGTMLFFEPLARMEPPADAITGHAGEWRGLDMQIHRLRVGVIHELLELLGQFEAEATGTRMSQLLKNATSKTKVEWAALIDIATGKGDASAKTFAKAIRRIRNNVAFHYYQPKDLLAGYRLHFFNSAKAGANEHAYCSIGRSMERTRFYFADAAIGGALQTIQGDVASSKFLKRLRKESDDINRVLEHILREYTRPARRHSVAL